MWHIVAAAFGGLVLEAWCLKLGAFILFLFFWPSPSVWLFLTTFATAGLAGVELDPRS